MPGRDRLPADVALQRAADFASGRLGLSVRERLHLARDLLHSSNFDAALGLYVNLWEVIPEEEPSLWAVRGSFMASEMRRMAQEHEPAARRFLALRDALESRLEQAPVLLRNDWLVLNRVVGDEDRSLRWFDVAIVDPTQRAALDCFQCDIAPLLEARRRWSDLGRLLRDPMTYLAEWNEVMSETATHRDARPMDAELKRMFANRDIRQRRHMYGAVYAAMLAAGRPEARLVYDDACVHDQSAGMRAVLAVYERRSRRPPRGTHSAQRPE